MFAAVPVAASDEGLLAAWRLRTFPPGISPIQGGPSSGSSATASCWAWRFRTLCRGCLLRSVVVPPARRGQGHGRAVAEAMLEKSARRAESGPTADHVRDRAFSNISASSGSSAALPGRDPGDAASRLDLHQRDLLTKAI